jgi:hypothetical protein
LDDAQQLKNVYNLWLHVMLLTATRELTQTPLPVMVGFLKPLEYPSPAAASVISILYQPSHLVTP